MVNLDLNLSINSQALLLGAQSTRFDINFEEGVVDWKLFLGGHDKK